jgi:alkylation response protein AidB-like acyl-CoA dehydrogenase
MRTAESVDVVAAAKEIGPFLRENSERADREGSLPSASVDAIRDAGLLRAYVPRSLGGLEIDPVSHALAQEELARNDSAAAWLLQVTGSTNWWSSRLPTEAVEEIYSDGPDEIIAVSFGNPVEAVPVDGGYRLTGQRPFASFCPEAGWLWLTALIMDTDGPRMLEGHPVTLCAFFPMRDATVVETWDTLGMRGTSSHDVSVTDLFVPEYRTFRIGIDHTPGPHYDGPLYTLAAMVASLSSELCPVILGVTKAAIDEFVAVAQGKTPFNSQTTLRDRPLAHINLGKALGLVRSARTYLLDTIGSAWDHAVAGTTPSFEEKTEYLLAGINAHTSCAQAMDLLYATAGTTGIYRRSRLEQHFRDVQVLRQHGFLNESRYQSVGQVALGLEPELGFVGL